MAALIAFLLFGLLSYLVICNVEVDSESHLIEGPCPSPNPAPDFKAQQLVGYWLDLFTTYDWIHKSKNGGRRCVQNYIQVDENDGSLLLNKTYVGKKGKKHFTSGIKFIPIVGQPGRFSTQVLTDEGLTDHDWVYTVVAFEGELYMEYACRMVGNKHKEFHRIRGRSTPAPQAAVDNLLAKARNNGDDRPAFQYDQSNCNYE